MGKTKTVNKPNQRNNKKKGRKQNQQQQRQGSQFPQRVRGIDQKNKVVKKNKGLFSAAKKKKKHTWRSVREKKTTAAAVVIDDGVPSEPSPVAVVGIKKPVKHKKAFQVTSSSSRDDSSSPPTSLRDRMLQRLSIARFRTLNASIDGGVSDTKPGKNPLANSRKMFESYHSGFQSAASTWKTNPLDLIAKWVVKHVPDNHIVADFGCGRADLAKKIPHETKSLDLHALDDSVIECDMRNTPLGDASAHVVVFCLSLMGNDVASFMYEAWRVLTFNGILKLAEVGSRFQTGHNTFISGMRKIGFKLMGEVEEVRGDSTKNKTALFVIMQFRKVVRREGDRNRKVSLQLGPCVYKKR